MVSPVLDTVSLVVRFTHEYRTIVGTEQVSYTFYVPSTVSVSDNPIAPFPTVTKYLPPGADKNDRRTEIGFTSNTDLPLVHMYVLL